ncbi:hypothetical protein [Longimicrobium sp.]|uniref:hypothetical protein n=1 Tax=Longimicrobium sp. TaxID=2029185 RepID=UPI003B3B5961
MSVQIRVLERDRTFTPLGIRFWDAALDTPVTDRLQVHAWLRDSAYPPVPAVRSPSGVYAFHRLPGQASAEKPAGDDARPETDGPAGEFVIAVDDPGGRYMGAAFSVPLPLGYRGEFLSGGPQPGKAYLFPAVSRPVPPGVAAIRADLADPDTGAPAAYAVLSATVGGITRTAVADEAGRAVVLVPFPTPERLRQGSPPADTRAATWPVSLRARWEPAALRYPFPAREGMNPAWAARPSLKSILDEQRTALVWTDEGQVPAVEWTETLVHGQELRLRTTLAGGGSAPTLWVSAGASPP